MTYYGGGVSVAILCAVDFLRIFLRQEYEDRFRISEHSVGDVFHYLHDVLHHMDVLLPHQDHRVECGIFEGSKGGIGGVFPGTNIAKVNCIDSKNNVSLSYLKLKFILAFILNKRHSKTIPRGMRGEAF